MRSMEPDQQDGIYDKENNEHMTINMMNMPRYMWHNRRRPHW